MTRIIFLLFKYNPNNDFLPFKPRFNWNGLCVTVIVDQQAYVHRSDQLAPPQRNITIYFMYLHYMKTLKFKKLTIPELRAIFEFLKYPIINSEKTSPNTDSNPSF